MWKRKWIPLSRARHIKRLFAIIKSMKSSFNRMKFPSLHLQCVACSNSIRVAIVQQHRRRHGFQQSECLDAKKRKEIQLQMNRVESESHQIARPANSCIRSRARHKIILRMCRAYKTHIVTTHTVKGKTKYGVRTNSC